VEILIALIVGGLIGWVASLVMGTAADMGLIANVVVGLVGSTLGYWLAPKVGIAPISRMGRYAVAILGAVVLIIILKLLGIYE